MKNSTANSRLSAITTIGIDLAKNVFQVHGVDGSDEVVLQRAVTECGVL